MLGACLRAQPDDAFQNALERLRTDHEFPGATAAYVLPDGRVCAFATGLDDVELKVPMRPESRMLAGSIGKSFVAAVALALVEERKMSLDDTVARWLPNAADLSGGTAIGGLTLGQLLTHTSGLRDYVDQAAFALKARETYFGPNGNPDAVFSPEELIKFATRNKPIASPGERFLYSDTDYLIVGLMIERAAGQTYEQELTRRFLTPLGLTATEPSDKRTLDGLSASYRRERTFIGLGEKLAEHSTLAINPASEWTGGGLVSNPTDLVRWAKELYEGRVLTAPYLDLLLHPSGAKDNYGLGTFLFNTRHGPAYGHGGTYLGFKSMMVYWPEKRIAVALQINCDRDDNLVEYADELASAIMN